MNYYLSEMFVSMLHACMCVYISMCLLCVRMCMFVHKQLQFFFFL